jgi:hypothetical protein
LDFATWPTPVVSRHGPESNEARIARGAKTGTTLVDAIAGWPTPRSRDIKDTSDGVWAMNRLDGKSRTDQLPHALKSAGNPAYGCLAKMDTFVERLTNLSMWLMGYTAQYLRHWETRSSRKSPTKSSST